MRLTGSAGTRAAIARTDSANFTLSTVMSARRSTGRTAGRAAASARTRRAACRWTATVTAPASASTSAMAPSGDQPHSGERGDAHGPRGGVQHKHRRGGNLADGPPGQPQNGENQDDPGAVHGRPPPCRRTGTAILRL